MRPFPGLRSFWKDHEAMVSLIFSFAIDVLLAGLLMGSFSVSECFDVIVYDLGLIFLFYKAMGISA